LIVDSSALVAILTEEDDAVALNRAIARSVTCAISAPTLLETSMVLSSRRGQAPIDALDAYLSKANISVLPFTADHAQIARDAFVRYGKGRHKAGLNFGDCIAYAAAKLEAMPLLFKGGDFSLTDIEPALD
jgi:ribonuclease VapC